MHPSPPALRAPICPIVLSIGFWTGKQAADGASERLDLGIFLGGQQLSQVKQMFSCCSCERTICSLFLQISLLMAAKTNDESFDDLEQHQQQTALLSGAWPAYL